MLVPGLTITVTAGTSTTTPGSVVHYTVTVTNSGQTPYTGASFTDPLAGVLDDAAYNNDAAATAGTRLVRQPEPDLDGGPGGRGGRDDHVLGHRQEPRHRRQGPGEHADVGDGGQQLPGRQHRCPVHRHGFGAGAGPADHGVGRDQHDDAGVGGALHGDGHQLRADPVYGAAFTDPLAGVLDDATYNNDAAATGGHRGRSFTSPNLAWTGNLAVGASATITFSVTVNNPDTGNKILASTITSATPGSNCAAGSGDTPCTVTVPVAVLTITNNSDVSTTTPGAVVRFTAVFTNAGQVPYTGITVASNITDVLDDATPNGDQTATSGTVTLTPTGISWTGSIPVGGSVTVTGTVTVNNPDTGNKVMASTLSTAAAGSNCPSGGTDPRCSVSVAVQIPALSITQAANTTAAVPGQQVTVYTVTIADTGPDRLHRRHRHRHAERCWTTLPTTTTPPPPPAPSPTPAPPWPGPGTWPPARPRPSPFRSR